MERNYLKKSTKANGFTLIELLVVIAIIAILAVVVFVALDPLTRFRDSRDSARWQDVSALVDAIKISQVDNGGNYIATITEIASSTPGDVFMINDGSATTGCDDQNALCDVAVSSDTSCVDLSDLVNSGYIGEIPVSHNGTGTWTSGMSGYTLVASSTGAIIIQACESENSSDIKIIR